VWERDVFAGAGETDAWRNHAIRRGFGLSHTSVFLPTAKYEDELV